ncbi:MAG: Ig-like domain-containing protein, partial [Candidatus Aminicenantes bacterium]
AENNGKEGSDTVDISPGEASKLAFGQQPTNTEAGSVITPAVTVAVLDENDNLVDTATDEVSLVIENNPGGGTLSGTTTKAAVNGVATFDDLSIDKSGDGYTLKASSGSATATITDKMNEQPSKKNTRNGISSSSQKSKETTIKDSEFKAGTSSLAEAISDSFNITAGTITSLVLTTYPSQVEAGSWSSKYTVQRQDEFGNSVTSGVTTVNLSSDSDGANKKFSETSGGSAVTSIDIPDGSSSKNFYYYDEKKGEWTVSVSSTDLTGDSQSLEVTAASEANLTMVSGDNQSGNLGETLDQDFVVKVTDDYGNPVSGTAVNWSIAQTPSGASGQSLSETSTTTDSDGEAKSRLTLGDKAGDYQVQAASSGLSGSPAAFTATATTEEAKVISKVSGDCQLGDTNNALPQPFVAKVTDDLGNPVSGITVIWEISQTPAGASGQSLSETSTTTDSDGEASSTLTLGDRSGVYTVEASSSGLSGSPLTFTATTGSSFFLKEQRFHMFSIPYQFMDGNAEKVLGDLGPYDPAQWRLFRYGGQYHEYPDVPDFSPGLGYWLITAQDKEIVVGGSEVNSEVTITLEPGWNQIGCPGTCSVSWDSVKSRNPDLFDNNTVTDVLWGYDNENGEYVMCDEMSPWQGYWVYNNSESHVNLIFPYQ